jgi:hypothetical protein
MNSERIIFIGLTGALWDGVIDAEEHIVQQYCFSTVDARNLTPEFLRHEIYGGAGGFVALIQDERDAAYIRNQGGMIIHIKNSAEHIEGVNSMEFKPWLDVLVINDGDHDDFLGRIEKAVGTQIKRVQQAAKAT